MARYQIMRSGYAYGVSIHPNRIPQEYINYQGVNGNVIYQYPIKSFIDGTEVELQTLSYPNNWGRQKFIVTSDCRYVPTSSVSLMKNMANNQGGSVSSSSQPNTSNTQTGNTGYNTGVAGGMGIPNSNVGNPWASIPKTNQPTPEKTDLNTIKTESASGISTTQKVGGVIGLAGGLYYSYYHKKGVWSYIGYGLLFGFIGQVGGLIISRIWAPGKSSNETDSKTPTGSGSGSTVVDKMVSLAQKMSGKIPTETDKQNFLNKYNALLPQEQSAINDYLTGALKIDYSGDGQKALADSFLLQNQLITKYGEGTLKKAISALS